MASEDNLPSSAEGERLLDDDDEDGVPEDEDEDEEDEVEARILQLQDQFQEVKQQRKEARLIPRPDSPTSAKERARSAERSRYLQRSTQATQEDEGKSRYEFAPRPQSASAALDRKIVNSVVSTVATVKEEPTTSMRDLGLGDGKEGGGRGGNGGGGGSSLTLETSGVAPQRGVFYLDSILSSCEEETAGDSRIVEEEEEEEDEEEVEADEWATAEEERRRRREYLRRRRKALEDRIPTQPKPEKPPPPPKTRLEMGLDFLRRDISHVVAKAAVVVPRGEGGGDGDGRGRGQRRAGGGRCDGGGGGGGSGDGDELAHARRVNRLAMREGMLGLRRSGSALQPVSGPSTSSSSPLHDTNARHARAAAAAAAATSSAGEANNTRPRTAGWQPAGKAFAAKRERDRAAAAAASSSSSSPTSIGLNPSASPSPSSSRVAVWRHVGEKSSVLAEASARYVPLNATPHSCVHGVPRLVRNGGENQVRANSDDPVELAKARVALHESKRALGPPEPCDFDEATLMGLHVRLKEANACARQLGLGTRYRSVPAGSRMIRIEVYYPDVRGDVDGATGGKGGEDGARNKRRRRKKRFVSVDAFMKSESRLLLQASYGAGGGVFRAMREHQRLNRPLSTAAPGSVKPSRLLAAAGWAKPGRIAARDKNDGAKLPSWR